MEKLSFGMYLTLYACLLLKIILDGYSKLSFLRKKRTKLAKAECKKRKKTCTVLRGKPTKKVKTPTKKIRTIPRSKKSRKIFNFWQQASTELSNFGTLIARKIPKLLSKIKTCLTASHLEEQQHFKMNKTKLCF